MKNTDGFYLVRPRSRDWREFINGSINLGKTWRPALVRGYDHENKYPGYPTKLSVEIIGSIESYQLVEFEVGTKLDIPFESNFE